MVVAQPANPPTASPVRGDDHNVEPVRWFDLEPFLSPCTDGIVAGQRLRHETFMSFFQGGLHEALDLLNIRGYDPRSKAVFRNNLGQNLPTLGVRLIDQGLPVDLQRVKEVEFDWNLARHVLDLMDSSKPPHQILKRNRLTSLPCRDNLSLDEKLRRFHMILGKINHLRDTIGHIGQSSAEDPDPVLAPVNLDSRSVEFVFESCSILVFCENLFSIIRHLGQHRFDWDEQSQTDAL